VLTGVLTAGTDKDPRSLAEAPVVLACKRFYIHSGMGFDNPYCLVPGLTNRHGTFQIRFPPPPRGLLTTLELCVWPGGSVSGMDPLLWLQSKRMATEGVLPAVECDEFARRLDWPPASHDYALHQAADARPAHLSIRVRRAETGARLAGTASTLWPSSRSGESLRCTWQLAGESTPALSDSARGAAPGRVSPLPEPTDGE